jgi:HAAS
MDPERLVAEYLQRLEAAAATLPPGRQSELVAEVREHIDAALQEGGVRDEVHVRNVLERLGTPAEIVAADADPQPPALQPPAVRPPVGGMTGGRPTSQTPAAGASPPG